MSLLNLKCLAAALAAAAVSPFAFAQEQQADVAAAAQPENPPAEAAAPVVPAENAPADAVPAEPVEKGTKLTAEQKKQLEVRLLSARKARIEAETALEKTRLAEKLAERNIERSRLEAETTLRSARTEAKLSDIEAEKRKLDAVLARDKARSNLERAERENKLRADELDVKISRLEQELTLNRYNRQISQVQAAETLRGIASSRPTGIYRKNPLENGKLYISDRRVELNGPVTPELAAYVAERIYFYNNQDPEYPIFIVIDNSPGGSVAAGYQIQKAMESSKAPVFVVVKSFAASMAAIITTSAERSFCYPGSVILQHQPSSGVKGNLKQMDESLRLITAWTRKINDKIAAKMGLTYEEYVAEMYKHNSRGDWSEFGEGAKEWRWVTDVVETMDETSVVRREDSGKNPGYPAQIRECRFDEQGKPYVELPTLQAGDMWMIYDPTDFYRVGA